MVYVDMLLTCHLFHIWVYVVGSMMKYFLNQCNTLEGMSVHFVDTVYFLYGDKHHHYFSHLHMELITSPVFIFNIFTSSVNHSDAMSKESTTFNPSESIGACISNRYFCYVSSYPYIPGCMHSPQFSPFCVPY
jgi:hypothetical protein